MIWTIGTTKEIMYELSTTKQFRRSVKRFKNNQEVLKELDNIIEILLHNEIPHLHKDHELVGNLKGLRELHIRPDLLLVYEKQDSILTLLLVNIGSHSELFK